MNSSNIGHARPEDIFRLDQLEKQISKNPHCYKKIVEKGILLYEPFHRTDDAIETLKYVIKNDPNNIEAYFWLAECLYDHDADYEQAEQVLRKALTINPNQADIHSLLATTILQLNGNIDEAEYHYKMAIKLEPSWIAPRRYLISLLIKKEKLSEAKQETYEALNHLLKTIPSADDPIIKHYELLVTGRHNPENKNRLQDLLKKIEKNEKPLI